MQKLITASLLLFVLAALQSKAFAARLECKFKDEKMDGVKTIQISDDYLIINKELEIPLEKSRVNCGNFGRQTRFDGSALGFQVVLKSCTTEAKLEGSLIDYRKVIAADVFCNVVQ